MESGLNYVCDRSGIYKFIKIKFSDSELEVATSYSEIRSDDTFAIQSRILKQRLS